MACAKSSRHPRLRESCEAARRQLRRAACGGLRRSSTVAAQVASTRGLHWRCLGRDFAHVRGRSRSTSIGRRHGVGVVERHQQRRRLRRVGRRVGRLAGGWPAHRRLIRLRRERAGERRPDAGGWRRCLRLSLVVVLFATRPRPASRCRYHLRRCPVWCCCQRSDSKGRGNLDRSSWRWLALRRSVWPPEVWAHAYCSRLQEGQMGDRFPFRSTMQHDPRSLTGAPMDCRNLAVGIARLAWRLADAATAR